MARNVRRFRVMSFDQRGAITVEKIVLLGLFVFVAAVGVALLGRTTRDKLICFAAQIAGNGQSTACTASKPSGPSSVAANSFSGPPAVSIAPVSKSVLPTPAPAADFRCKANDGQECVQIAEERHVTAAGVFYTVTEHVHFPSGYDDVQSSDTAGTTPNLDTLVDTGKACKADGVYCEDYTRGPDGIQVDLWYANGHQTTTVQVQSEGPSFRYVCACFNPT